MLECPGTALSILVPLHVDTGARWNRQCRHRRATLRPEMRIVKSIRQHRATIVVHHAPAQHWRTYRPAPDPGRYPRTVVLGERDGKAQKEQPCHYSKNSTIIVIPHISDKFYSGVPSRTSVPPGVEWLSIARQPERRRRQFANAAIALWSHPTDDRFQYLPLWTAQRSLSATVATILRLTHRDSAVHEVGPTTAHEKSGAGLGAHTDRRVRTGTRTRMNWPKYLDSINTINMISKVVPRRSSERASGASRGRCGEGPRMIGTRLTGERSGRAAVQRAAGRVAR